MKYFRWKRYYYCCFPPEIANKKYFGIAELHFLFQNTLLFLFFLLLLISEIPSKKKYSKGPFLQNIFSGARIDIPRHQEWQVFQRAVTSAHPKHYTFLLFLLDVLHEAPGRIVASAHPKYFTFFYCYWFLRFWAKKKYFGIAELHFLFLKNFTFSLFSLLLIFEILSK